MEFFKTKKGMVEPTCAKFQQWKEIGKPVTHMSMDNAGENVKLIEWCKSADWKLGIKKFELKACDTPQQNSVVEVKFPTISGRAHAMMYCANVPYDMKLLVIGKAIETATKLDGLILVDGCGKQVTRYDKFGLEKPDWAKSLRIWREASVVKLKTKTLAKSDYKGTTCMFVGYPEDHSAGCWEMLDPQTKGIHKTRDVAWLHCMY